jgi:tryptophanyl-tRNA synthetase
MRIFSGIQPTGAKHFGNYSGGFRQYAATQDLGDAFFCIVDLHSLTTPQEPEGVREATLDLAAMLLATGLDPDRSTIFIQSQVPAHTECAWILGCIATYGELRRMTQFKEKGEGSAGLFTYPVLMAADILLYHTDKVPIGDDQRQHLELTRNIAERFNSRYGETFKLPEGIYPEVGARVMDLQEPERKMSTTGGTSQGTIGLLDPPDTVRRKVRSAVTDSGSDVRRADDKPGITNLIDIMAVATGSTPEEIESRYDGSGYGKFKEEVAEAVVSVLDPIRLRYGELRGNPDELRGILARGAGKAEVIASETLRTVYDRVGLVSS